MTITTARTEHHHAAPAGGPSRVTALRQGVGQLAGDIGLPLAGYYGLHALGCSDVVALLGGSLAAALRVAVVAVRTRRVTPFAILMLAVYAVGLGLAFVGDPHVLLLKESVGTGMVGLGFLGSLVVGRPMVLVSMETWRTARSERVLAAYPTSPVVRRTIRGMTALWGVGLLADAVLRIPVVFALPVDVGVAVSQGLTLGVMAVLTGITLLIARHATRAVARERHGGGDGDGRVGVAAAS